MHQVFTNTFYVIWTLINTKNFFYRPRDLYHTCYTLSGLSVAQHGTGALDPYVIGSSRNELNTIHPLHNIAPHLAYNALHYFIRHPPPVKDNN